MSDEELDQLPLSVYTSDIAKTKYRENIDEVENQNQHEDEEIECTICLSTFEEGQSIRTIMCLHQFHKDCIDPWLKKEGTCPICKTSFSGYLSSQNMFLSQNQIGSAEISDLNTSDSNIESRI